MSSDIKMDFGETKYETVKLTEMAEKVEEFWSFEYAGGDLSTSTGWLSRFQWDICRLTHC